MSVITTGISVMVHSVVIVKYSQTNDNILCRHLKLSRESARRFQVSDNLLNTESENVAGIMLLITLSMSSKVIST